MDVRKRCCNCSTIDCRLTVRSTGVGSSSLIMAMTAIVVLGGPSRITHSGRSGPGDGLRRVSWP